MQRCMRLFTLVGAACLALLAGCASDPVLRSSVQSYSGLPALPAPPSYRFERLPLQQAQPSQAQVEALADPALFNVGLRRDDAAPRLSVQVSARVQRVWSPWADPWDGWGWGGPRPWSPRYGGFGYAATFPRDDQVWFQREVGVVVRDVASNKVVFESQASNEGPWWDGPRVLGALFEAALAGFPNPPSGPRQVDVRLSGRQGQVTGPAVPVPAPSRSTPATASGVPAPSSGVPAAPPAR